MLPFLVPVIHILDTGVLKLKKKSRRQRVNLAQRLKRPLEHPTGNWRIPKH